MKLFENVIQTRDIEESLKEYLSSDKYSQIAILVDENTKACCYPVIKRALPEHHIIEIESGEEEKNLDTCQVIWGGLTDLSFDRKSLLINLGGGVIGDMGGFCAATYKRGIDFINIPTTLLSQVDASIGGKLGIDFKYYKNHIGVFQDPNMVFLDSVFLETLEYRELKSGFAEIIKHCLIADGEKFKEIKNKKVSELDWHDLVAHSAHVKNKVVTEDPKESGLRKILNFGHTIGHAIESFYLGDAEKKLLHGEAIAVGMICEAYLSFEKTGLSREALDEITEYLVKVYEPTSIDMSDVEQIIELTSQDKKNEKNKVQCSLLESIGKCTFNIEIQGNEIKEAIHYYNNQLSLSYTK